MGRNEKQVSKIDDLLKKRNANFFLIVDLSLEKSQGLSHSHKDIEFCIERPKVFKFFESRCQPTFEDI